MTTLEPRIDGIPTPTPSPEAGPYWEGTRAGELRYQACATCGAANFGPGLRCHACQADTLEWRRSAGEGVVYSWTVVWRPQTPAFDVPYAPAIIRLDEGYDMVSALVGLVPDDIEAGMRVRVEFHALDDTITLPFFRPA
ncbi:MAG: OB-fold domain-containing protein [Actinomycetota bacterium]